MSNLLNQSPIWATERFGNLFDDLFEKSSFLAGWHPAVDVKKTETDYIFTIEAPGVNKEDINVELHGEILTISGKRVEEKEEQNETYLRRERSMGTFNRSFRLDDAIKADQIHAEYRDGILTIKVPKRDHSEPQRIAIR
ncbi:MAG: Hsp20 family protein [Armatimonadetes bacterium]|nr:Hsp20 family protein [Armatimonadota bacterium]